MYEVEISKSLIDTIFILTFCFMGIMFVMDMFIKFLFV